MSQASINASIKIEAAKRRDSAIISERTALVAALKPSIDQIGVEGTMELKMTELYGDLIQSGAIPVVVLTNDSIFPAPFYPGTGDAAAEPTRHGP